MTDMNQVISDMEVSLANMESIVAAMKQTNANMVPLRQQILVMWRDNLSVGIDNIASCLTELREFKCGKIGEKLEKKLLEEEKERIKKAVPEFSVKKKNKK